MLNQAVMPIAMVALGFVSLTKGATWLVDGARALARRLGVSELLIGLTVVAFGTSLPEMTVNLFSAAQGSAELALGNVLGSNVCNILLILGVCALVRPVVFPRGVCRFELPVAAGVAPKKIAFDPGLGFGKTFDQNWSIVANLERFHALGGPLLLGFSRKTFLRETTRRYNETRGLTDETALPDVATLDQATATRAALVAPRGVEIMRVHNVRQTALALEIARRSVAEAL